MEARRCAQSSKPITLGKCCPDTISFRFHVRCLADGDVDDIIATVSKGREIGQLHSSPWRENGCRGHRLVSRDR